MRSFFLYAVGLLAIVVFSGTPVSAGEGWDYQDKLPGGHHDPPASGYSDCDLDISTGEIYAAAEVSYCAVGQEVNYWAWALIGKKFTYGGYNYQPVTFIARCRIKGEMAYNGTAHNYLDLRIEVRDLTTGGPPVTEQHFPDPDDGYYYPKEDENWACTEGRDESVSFQTSLVHGHEYAMALVVDVACWCDTLEAGSSTVDLWSAGYEVDLQMLEVYWEGTYTEGGNRHATPSSGFFHQYKQDQYNYADRFALDLYNNEEDIDGWRVDFSDFRNSYSFCPNAPDSHTVHAYADNDTLLKGQTCLVWGEALYDGCTNHFHVKNQHFEPVSPPPGPAQDPKILPDYYWDFGVPESLVTVPDTWLHVFTMKNDDTNDTLKVRGLKFLTTWERFDAGDLYKIDFGEAPVTDFNLAPQTFYSDTMITGGAPVFGWNIYFEYQLMDSTGDSVVCNAWGYHPINDPDPTGVNSSPSYVNNLTQNYPNPFNPTTTIEYSVKERAWVTLKIYNVTGQLVKTLVNEEQRPRIGGHAVKWDGRNNRGQPVSSGVYFYKLVTKDFATTRKLVVIK